MDANHLTGDSLNMDDLSNKSNNPFGPPKKNLPFGIKSVSSAMNINSLSS